MVPDACMKENSFHAQIWYTLQKSACVQKGFQNNKL